jgi:hypothetical protein
MKSTGFLVCGCSLGVVLCYVLVGILALSGGGIDDGSRLCGCRMWFIEFGTISTCIVMTLLD